MAEAEASRRVGRPDEVELEQLVEGSEHSRDVALGDRGDQLGLERLTGDGRRLEATRETRPRR